LPEADCVEMHGNQFPEKLEEFLTTEDTELHGVRKESGKRSLASFDPALILLSKLISVV